MKWTRKVNQTIGNKLGKCCFFLAEPFQLLRENIRPRVRKYFDQALRSIENKKIGAALLNLNMVLSLKPDHFLACVYRGRIYLREKNYSLASNDFIRASKISPYRFLHYNLYREYLDSIHRGFSHRAHSMEEKFNEVFRGWQAPDIYTKHLESNETWETEEPTLSLGPEDEEGIVDPYQDGDLSWEERERFDDMGPITGKEIENTDWESLIRKLTS